MHSEIDMNRLILVAQGHSAFQLLWAGVELGLFDILSKNPGLNQTQIRSHLNLDPYPLRLLLIGLGALGLIIKRDGDYHNAALTETFLIHGKPESLTPVLGWQAHIVYPGLLDFLESLKKNTNVGLRHFPGDGTTLYERLVSHPDKEKIFQDAMSGLSLQANQHIVDAYDFGKFSHIVDAGGGDGTNAIALAKRYPKLKVTVYDSESVCKIAQEKIADARLSDRVFTHVGNFITDPFPSDLDAILFCHIFTIWSMDHNKGLLKKCRQSLPNGGAVVIFNMMGDDDEMGPLSTALGSPYFLAIATGEGMLHAWKDYELAMQETGFSKITRVEGFPLNHGLLVAQL